jgi:hypothetical protein
MPDCSRKASVRVPTAGDILKKATRSTGWSISILIPGWRTMSGSIPRSRAASRWGVEAVFAETQRNDIRRRTNDRVRSEIVMRRHDGEGRRGRCAARVAAISADDNRGMSPGIVQLRSSRRLRSCFGGQCRELAWLWARGTPRLLSGCTTRIGFSTQVLILPQRQPCWSPSRLPALTC